MNRSLVWIGGGIVLIGAIAAILYFRSGTRVEPPRAGWTVAARPPGDRIAPGVQMVREYGVWHLSCRKLPGRPTASAPIQNLGIAGSPEMAAMSNCHVFTKMVNSDDRRQTVIVDFRFTQGNVELRVACLHTLTTKENVPPPSPRPLVGLDPKTKELKLGPGSNRDVQLVLGSQSLVLGAKGCHRGRCIALGTTEADTANTLGSAPKVVVGLPPLSKGVVRIVRIPGQGLQPALQELRRLTPT